jgi:hypothetical protein
MKKTTMIAALVVSASLGTMAVNAATAIGKLGVLNFALTDTYQHFVYLNGAQNQVTACQLKDCPSTDVTKYVTGTDKINNARILAAIGKTLGVKFTSKAKLVVVDYENDIPNPAYPMYLECEFNPDVAIGGADTFNAPVDFIFNVNNDPTVNGGFAWEDALFDFSFGAWPNEQQIDWVDYSTTTPNWAESVTHNADPNKSLWPRATVHVSDPSNAALDLQCVDVSAFFSFEEAYCYFCWDTVDRVTSGSASITQNNTGTICTQSGCSYKGSGTTKWYFTIKFNNNPVDNQFLALEYGVDFVNTLQSADELVFAASGVISYPWVYKTVDGLGDVWGTMTMAQAAGYANDPFCGVLAGSITITESDDTKVPLPCVF